MKELYMIIVPNSKFPFAGTDQLEINETLKSFQEWIDIFQSNGFSFSGCYKDKSISDKYHFLKKKLFELVINIFPLSMTYQFVFILSKKTNNYEW